MKALFGMGVGSMSGKVPWKKWYLSWVLRDKQESLVTGMAYGKHKDVKIVGYIQGNSSLECRVP